MKMNPKLDLHIGGRDVPGIIVSDVWTSTVTLEASNGRPARNIPARFAEVISLRETNPDGPNPGVTYLRKTPENLGFTTERDSYVIGLDVTEDGALISSVELNKMLGKDINDRQVARLAQQFAQVVDLDEDFSEEDVPAPATAPAGATA